MGARVLWEQFVADIFNEIDEEVRRERLQRLWQNYSLHIIVVAVLIVAAIGAWRGYEWYSAKQAAEAGAKFEAAVALAEAGKHDEAQTAFAALSQEAPGGYGLLSRLRAAAELAPAKPEEAAKAYDALAADTSLTAGIRDLAAVRAALLRVDTASFADIEQKLGPLAEPGRAFRHTAREVLALSAWRAKDFTNASKYIQMITTDAEAPPNMRNRVEVLSALIAAAGKS